MKKFFLLLLTLIPVYVTGQITGEILLAEQQLELSKVAGYDKVIFGTDYIREISKPELPVVRKSYVVPVNAGNIHIETTILKKRKMEGSYLVFPAQPPRVSNYDEKEGFTEPDQSVYSSSLPFPGKSSEVVSSQIVQGYRVIELVIYPVEYIPLEKTIYLYDLSFTVTYDLSAETPTAPHISERRAKLAQSLVESLVDNPAEVAMYTDRSVIIPENTDMNARSSTSAQRSIQIMEEIVPDYLIITSNELKSSFQKLADWKIKRGIPTILKTVEEIDVAYPGSDLADKIRNYLTDARRRWNGNGLSVLLGGDVNHVPTKMVKSNYSSETGLFATDLGYVSDSFTWNYATNTYTLNDVSSYIGRLPAKTPSEADTYITRILNYEKSTQKVDPSYYNNFLISAAFMEPKFTDGHMSDFDKYRKDNLALHSRYYYLFEHFNCDNVNKDHQPQSYDHTYGNELTVENFLSALKNGVSFGRFHFIYHEDHSVTTSFGITSKNKGGSIEQKHLSLLPETPYYNIIMSSSCHPANFSQDCIAEDFIRYAGTVAFIGNSDIGWRSEYNQYEAVLKALFNSVSSNSSQFNLGYLLQAARSESFIGNYTKHKLHLLGDPEMPVWTATPQNLQVSINKSLVVTGENQITIKVNNLPIGQEAVICLMKGDEGYARKTVTAASPQATFRFVPRTSGQMDVTVTAHNFRPHESTIPVVLNESSSIAITDLVFDDDDQVDSRGDGNHKPDAGETIELGIKLKNNGREPVYGLMANLSCNSHYIGIPIRSADIGDIGPGETVTANFIFGIDKDAPEILKNDFNAVRFYLNLTDSRDISYPDTFRIDVFAPELELREQTVTESWGNPYSCSLKVALMNVGKAQASGLTAVLSPGNASVSSCPVNTSSYPTLVPNATGMNNNTFSFNINSFSNPNNPQLKLLVRNRFGRQWTFNFNPKEKCSGVLQSDLKFNSYVDAVDIYWAPIAGASGYNIYRSDNGVNGTYVKQNLFPLPASYYKDTRVDRLKTYNYKVTTLSASGNQSAMSGAIKAWTSWPFIGLFPRFTSESKNIAGSVNVADVDYDGKKEIFLTERIWNANGDGYLLGLRHDGEELFDIDGNVTSFSGFAKLSTTAQATPAIGDLKGNGEQNIVTVTWKDSNIKEDRNSIECFASRDHDGDRLPDKLWSFDMDTIKSYRGVVLSNIDCSSDGTMEVLCRSIQNGDPIRIIDSNGNLRRKIDIPTDNLTMLAAADLDGDGDKEILASAGNSLYIWHHDGTPFKTNPFFTCEQELSSPVVCDLNMDGKKEILVAGQKTATSKIFAVNLSGQCLAGWNGSASAASIPYTVNSLDHSISVGDINKDGKPEVVALGRNVVKAWKNDGTELFSRTIEGLFPDKKYAANFVTPILADVDGSTDSYMPDIVFGSETGIYALHNDGTDVVGFPIQTPYRLNGSVSVADINNDGKNELVAADEGQVYAWETAGSPSAIEWGSERHDAQNTGEYAPICEAKLILTNTIWNGVTPCGNIIVQAGKFTVPSGKNLSLQKTSKIIVRSGATLEVDGGTVSNASVWALPGGNVVLKNNGAIRLRGEGNLTIDKGATFDHQYGIVE